MSLKIVIVGCGKIADAHVEEIRRIPSARLVAVCDLEPVMAKQLASRYGIPRWYVDAARMLDMEEPDVVHITTPPQSHPALTRLAVAAGCHVFLEKPVAVCQSRVETIIAEVTTAQRKLCVNYWPNFEAPAYELRRLYKTGALGDAVHLESLYGYNLEGEYGSALKRDPDHWVNHLPGKLFQNVLDHVLNKIVPYLDDDEPFIHAIAYRGESVRDEAPACLPLDELRVVIQGLRTSAYATFSSHSRPVGHTLRVYGTKNTACADFAARTVAVERKQTFPSALGRLLPPFLVAKDYLREGLRNVNDFAHARFHYFSGMHRLLTEFYRCIETDSPPPISYSEIVRVSAMMDKIFRQVYPEVTV
jgi:predicted dehydrogenase